MSYVIGNECCMLIMEFASVRQSITNCISKFIQCEDSMLTGPTSKRVPFNRPIGLLTKLADDSISQICQ